jgi:hypothetical protein
MSAILSNDLRLQCGKAFRTLRGIVEVFPVSRWREPHGDEYYIPCRIAYHLAAVIGFYAAGGSKDKDFFAKLPYGRWIDAKADDLPGQAEFLVYLDAVLVRAEQELSKLTDSDLYLPIDPERAWAGSSNLGLYLFFLRELSDHTGELNKMLIENGVQDVWISRE